MFIFDLWIYESVNYQKRKIEMNCGQQSNSSNKSKMESETTKHLKTLTKEELAEWNRQQHIRNLKVIRGNCIWAVGRCEKDIKELEERLQKAKENLQRLDEEIAQAEQ